MADGTGGLSRVQLLIKAWYVSCGSAVQIPPSTAYAPPMKRPIEEEEANDDKSPNKKKKKLQKKCKSHRLTCSTTSLHLTSFILKIVSSGTVSPKINT